MATVHVHPAIVCHQRKSWHQIMREIKEATGRTVMVVNGKLLLWGDR